MTDKNAARTRAETAFSASAQRDAQIKDDIAKERAAFDIRTIKLRALRMAREEQERADKATADALKPPKGTRKARKPPAPDPVHN